MFHCMRLRLQTIRKFKRARCGGWGEIRMQVTQPLGYIFMCTNALVYPGLAQFILMFYVQAKSIASIMGFLVNTT